MMKVKSFYDLIPWLAAIGGLLLLGLAIGTGLTQHHYQLREYKKLQLRQIRSAVTDFLRDHPGSDSQWPAVFMAGSYRGSIWCEAVGSEVPVMNLASSTQPYLRLFPVDPGRKARDATLYYFQKQGSQWLISSCLESPDFGLIL